MIKIGFLGPEGTFSQEATQKYIKHVMPENKKYKELAFSTIQEIISNVSTGKINEAVIPIENSLEGGINETLDILATKVNLMIKAEINISIEQNLLVKKGTNMDDIECIISHPQAIGQCRSYITKNFKNKEIRFSYSTAQAVLEVMNSNGNMGAIGSAISTKVYDVEILAEKIQDSENNVTRFIVISDTDSPKTNHDKTSIVFSTDDKPGSLYKILDIFNLWDINMTRVESRPTKNWLGNYMFFIDINGHKDDENLKSALIMVQRKTSFFRFLGSYPQWL